MKKIEILTLGFFYYTYKKRFLYWDIIIKLRSVFLLIIAKFLLTYQNQQTLLILCILLIALIL